MDEEKENVSIIVNYIEARSCYQAGTTYTVYSKGSYYYINDTDAAMLNRIKRFLEHCNQDNKMQDSLELYACDIKRLLIWFTWIDEGVTLKIPKLNEQQRAFFETLKFLDMMHNISKPTGYQLA